MKSNNQKMTICWSALAIFFFAARLAYAASAGDDLAPAASAKKLSSPPGKGSLITIAEDDWEQLLIGEWMVEFHAPWCPACRALQPEWKTFSGWASELGIKVGAVDVTANVGLSGRFLVTALPTIYHVKDGVFRQYKGTRDTNAFVSFIEEKKWQSIDPVTSWKAPDTLQMSFISQLFRISMALRSVHNSLVEDYGIPYWGSYIVFAFATILFGAILGLMIVCVIDMIWPARPLSDAAYKESGSSAKSSGGEQSRQKKSGKKSSDDEDDVADDDDDDDQVGEEEELLDDEEDEDYDDEEDSPAGDDGAKKASGADDDDQDDEDEDDKAQQQQQQQQLRKRRARRDGN